MWNKRAVAIVTVAAFVGVLSPVSASAWSEDDPDEIVTATVDLGNGNGGGGGGDTDGCTGYSTLDIPTNNLPLTYQITRAKNPAMAAWVDDQSVDGRDANNDPTDDTALENFYFEEWNTQRDYVSQDLEIAFDANNCTGSEDWAELDFERMPVERANLGGGWDPVEMTAEHGVLASDILRAMADLMLDRGLVNGNVNTVRVFADMWGASDITGGDINTLSMSNWGTLYDDLSSLQEPKGTSGTATVRSVLTLLGDEAKGKYRVKYGIHMWLD